MSRLAGSGEELVKERARRRVGRLWLDTLYDVAEREALDLVLVIGSSRFSLRERALRLAAARNPRLPEVVALQAGSATPRADRRRSLVFVGRRAAITPSVADAARRARIVVLEDIHDPSVVGLADRLTWGGGFELVASSTDRDGYFVFRRELGRPSATSPPGHGPEDPASRPDRRGTPPPLDAAPTPTLTTT
jgi:hypothetical protein